MNRRGLSIVLAGGIILVVLTGAAYLLIQQYGSTRNQLVIELHPDTRVSGDEASLNFDLPRGNYALIVHREGVMDEQTIGKIRFDLGVPEQQLVIQGEKSINFNLNISEIRLEYFKVDRQSRGELSIRIIEPSGTDFKVKIVRNPFP